MPRPFKSAMVEMLLVAKLRRFPTHEVIELRGALRYAGWVDPRNASYLRAVRESLIQGDGTPFDGDALLRAVGCVCRDYHEEGKP